MSVIMVDIDSIDEIIYYKVSIDISIIRGLLNEFDIKYNNYRLIKKTDYNTYILFECDFKREVSLDEISNIESILNDGLVIKDVEFGVVFNSYKNTIGLFLDLLDNNVCNQLEVLINDN